jgi:hypothetical protein
VFVITSLASPGVVIQLDGCGAKRLAMTLSGSFLFLRKPPRLLPPLAMTELKLVETLV